MKLMPSVVSAPPGPTVSRLNAGGLPVVLRAMVLGPSMVSGTVTFGRAELST